jgi:hypothetical protein
MSVSNFGRGPDELARQPDAATDHKRPDCKRPNFSSYLPKQELPIVESSPIIEKRQDRIAKVFTRLIKAVAAIQRIHFDRKMKGKIQLRRQSDSVAPVIGNRRIRTFCVAV